MIIYRLFNDVIKNMFNDLQSVAHHAHYEDDCKW